MVGASPGTLVINRDAGDAKIRLIQYTLEQVEEFEIRDAKQLDGLVDPDKVNWIDVQGLDDLRALTELGRIFGLHALTLESVVNIPQRPKIEENDGYQLVIFRGVAPNGGDDLSFRQFSLIIGPHFVLSFQEEVSTLLDVVRRRARRPKSRVRQQKADYLSYVILDTLVDGLYPILEQLGEQLAILEEEVIDSPTPKLLKRLNKKKNQLLNMRRTLWPLREVIRDMMCEDTSCFGNEVRIYLRDTNDHCVQITDVIEMYREMATGLLNTYLSSVGQRTNEVMKILTIMASIFIPLTFIAGIYGMNFEHMPELQFKWAYPLVWGAMASLVVCMLVFFKKQGWLRDIFKLGASPQKSEKRPDKTDREGEESKPRQ